jgi:hypothetical protein
MVTSTRTQVRGNSRNISGNPWTYPAGECRRVSRTVGNRSIGGPIFTNLEVETCVHSELGGLLSPYWYS